MEKLTLDRITGKRADNKNEYLLIKPEHPDNLKKLATPKKLPSQKTCKNVKNGKWHY